MRCLITLKVESNNISIDTTVTDSTIRKVINAWQENYKTKLNWTPKRDHFFYKETNQLLVSLHNFKLNNSIWETVIAWGVTTILEFFRTIDHSPFKFWNLNCLKMQNELRGVEYSWLEMSLVLVAIETCLLTFTTKH